MPDALRLFVGPRAALAPFKALQGDVRFYVLTRDAELAVLPFGDALQDRMHDRYGTGDWPENQGILLSTTDQSFAADCSQYGPIAYLQRDGIDGAELQAAAVWQHGHISVGPAMLDLGGANARRAAPLQPINVALRALGITALPGQDEMSSFGLGEYASNADITARARVLG